MRIPCHPSLEVRFRAYPYVINVLSVVWNGGPDTPEVADFAPSEILETVTSSGKFNPRPGALLSPHELHEGVEDGAGLGFQVAVLVEAQALVRVGEEGCLII